MSPPRLPLVQKPVTKLLFQVRHSVGLVRSTLATSAARSQLPRQPTRTFQRLLQEPKRPPMPQPRSIERSRLLSLLPMRLLPMCQPLRFHLSQRP